MKDSTRMLTCKEVVDFLIDYDAGDLAPAQKQEFDRHLAMCPACVCYIQTYHQAIQLGRAACDSAKPEPIPEELVRAILAARQAGK